MTTWFIVNVTDTDRPQPEPKRPCGTTAGISWDTFIGLLSRSGHAREGERVTHLMLSDVGVEFVVEASPTVT